MGSKLQKGMKDREILHDENDVKKSSKPNVLKNVDGCEDSSPFTFLYGRSHRELL
jgi:hypothetical protein